jgi:RNA exonuclease 4
MAIPLETQKLNGPAVTGYRRQRIPSQGSQTDTSSTSSNSDHEATPIARNRRRKRSTKNKKANAKGPSIPLEEQAKYVAMDCEMVGVGMDGLQSALARVTIVDWNGEILLDEYIKPDCEVTDYRTYVSGIRENDLANARDLESCRMEVMEILRDKILVGHALKNDLTALRIRHPWYLTRDTAKYEPFMKVRFDDGILWPRKLRDLCQEKLKRNIQLPGQPHSAFEDAVAALDLYKSVRNKWEKVMDYKIKKTQEIEALKAQ